MWHFFGDEQTHDCLFYKYSNYYRNNIKCYLLNCSGKARCDLNKLLLFDIYSDTILQDTETYLLLKGEPKSWIFVFIIYKVMKYRKILIKYNAYFKKAVFHSRENIKSCIFTAVKI